MTAPAAGLSDAARAAAAQAAGRSFYVSVRAAERYGLLAGPFAAYDEALGWVDRTRAAAAEVDQWAGFYAYGVCSTTSIRAGRLNARLGLAC